LQAQRTVVPEAKQYLGEVRPGGSPRLFGANRISDGMSNRDMAISPAGDELFYTIQSTNGRVSLILRLYFAGGKWIGPEVASFSGIYEDLEPAFSISGDSLYFVSNRPVGGGAQKDFDIWMVKRSRAGWGEPVRLDTVVNSSRDEFYPSVARNGNLYFTREIEGGKGKEDIVVSEWKNGRYQPPYSLSEAINSEKYEFNAFVDPDEQYLLFTAYGRPGGYGGGDLFLSCKDGKGQWKPAVCLDSTINSTTIDFCPFVTVDKKYLFFTSGKMEQKTPFSQPLDFGKLKQLLEGPGNGLNDIYWIEWQPLLKKYCP